MKNPRGKYKNDGSLMRRTITPDPKRPDNPFVEISGALDGYHDNPNTGKGGPTKYSNKRDSGSGKTSKGFLKHTIKGKQ